MNEDTHVSVSKDALDNLCKVFKISKSHDPDTKLEQACIIYLNLIRAMERAENYTVYLKNSLDDYLKELFRTGYQSNIPKTIADAKKIIKKQEIIDWLKQIRGTTSE